MYIITGCPRSGTTYLQRYLNQDKQIICLHECGHLVSGPQRLDYLSQEKEFLRILEEKNVNITDMVNNWPHLSFNYPIVIDKYPHYSECLHRIDKNTKIILCVRDPISSYCSMMDKLGWSSEKTLETMINSYNSILLNIEKYKYCTVKYEHILCSSSYLRFQLESFLPIKLNFIDHVTRYTKTYFYDKEIVDLLDHPTINQFREKFNYEKICT